LENPAVLSIVKKCIHLFVIITGKISRFVVCVVEMYTDVYFFNYCKVMIILVFNIFWHMVIELLPSAVQ